MTQPNTVRRQCPTRLDGADTLIAHWITANTCSDRQHRHYHKCFGCTFGYASDINQRTLEPLPKPAVPVKEEPKEAPQPAAAQAV